MGNTIHTGQKFFRFLEGSETPSIIRILKVDQKKNTVRYLSDEKKETMTIEELDTYKALRADGIIMFSIVNVSEVQDVIVALSKFPNETGLPYAVCRQSIFDFFSNNTTKYDDRIYTGVSVSQDTCPANIDFKQVMSCNGVEYNKPVAIYLDDTLDDILSLFRHERFDKVLSELEATSKANLQHQNKLILGYNKSLRELMTANNFMYDFRKCFGIMEVPDKVDEESEALSPVNILYLENELKVNIMETYLVKYTREIDLRSIKRNYVLVSSAAENFSSVYIVGYDKADGEYVRRTLV